MFKIKVPAWSGPGEGFLPVAKYCLFILTPHGIRKEGAS